jgi:hypothetical protein
MFRIGNRSNADTAIRTISVLATPANDYDYIIYLITHKQFRRENNLLRRVVWSAARHIEQLFHHLAVTAGLAVLGIRTRAVLCRRSYSHIN